MSTKFESPTAYLSDPETTPYSSMASEKKEMVFQQQQQQQQQPPQSSQGAGLGPREHQFPKLSSLNQEFFNALQNRQAPQYSSSTGWSTDHVPAIYGHQHIEDLQPIESNDLNALMKDNQTLVLVIDVRSFSFYTKSHIESAIHISIPSVLLKRPAYTLDKLYESIQPPEAADRLKNWHNATHIIFYDHSSYKPSDSGNSATAVLLGSKLRKANYQGNLNYLQGGFNAFSKLFPDQCQFVSPNTDKSKDCVNGPIIATPSVNQPAFNPFFSNIRQNLELAHGPLKERFEIRVPYGNECVDGIISSTSPVHPTSFTPTSHHPRFGLAGSSVSTFGNFVLPVWLKDMMQRGSGPKKLAQKYEKLERIEQKRLSTIMNYHATSTTTVSNSQTSLEFPFSITSSMEKGALNRYDNIWPYEYSRVKLDENNDEYSDDDYINANYIQFANIRKNITLSPIQKSSQEVSLENEGLLSEASVRTMNRMNVDLASNRQYICTQGPLPTTFNIFWQMIWTEESSVIVMLTQEMEMNKIKCHRYWPSQLNIAQTYGAFQITLLSESKQAVLNMNDKRKRISDDDINQDECIIVRKFRLQQGYMTRTVTHLQYTGWTDFGVPDHPIGILQLAHLSDLAFERSPQHGPVVVHCSAGCGRSGTFCVIDTMIQRLWHKRDVYTSSTKDKVFETVSRFREQRMSMVQTHRQFVFCYEAILWWLLGYGDLPVTAEEENEPVNPTLLIGMHHVGDGNTASNESILTMPVLPTPLLPSSDAFPPPPSLFSAEVGTTNDEANHDNHSDKSSLGSIVENFSDM